MSAPPQGLPLGCKFELTFWVGIDGGQDKTGAIINWELLQVCIIQCIDTTTSPPTYSIRTPFFMWLVPDPDTNASKQALCHDLGTQSYAVIDPGDEIFLWISYESNPDGSPYGNVSCYNCTKGWQTPFHVVPPPGATCAGKSIEWIIENGNETNPDRGWPPVVPQFTPFELILGQDIDPRTDGVITNMQDTTISGKPIVTWVSLEKGLVKISYWPRA